MSAIGISVFQGYGPDHEPFGLHTAERIDSNELLKLSGVRHASAYGLQVALLAHAARAAIGDARTGIDARRALVTNGGPWAIETALGFLKTARDRGSQFVNPLVFPATLVSAGAAVVGITIGAGAVAIAVGHDELAFFEMLRRSRQLISHGVADQIIAAAACAPSAALITTLRIAGRTARIGECSVAFRLEADMHAAMVLEDITIGSDPSPWSSVSLRVEASVSPEGWTVSEGCTLADRQFLSASGAVLCATALRRYLTDAPSGQAMVVTCRRSGVIGAAKFRKR